jgi:DNA repair protein RadA/Sms
MSSKHHPFVCTACGAVALRWVGQCPSCRAWNTLEEGAVEEAVARREPVAVSEVVTTDAAPLSLGVSEVDRVLNGGVLPGSVTLVAGAPGIGKSTLCLQAAVFIAGRGSGALVVAAEESAQQVATRAQRLGGGSSMISLLATSTLDDAAAALETTDAQLVVIDSVSTMTDPSLRSPGGGVTQVRNAAERLATIARQRNVALILVGHVTKDGDLAGPRALEHLVDTVVTIEGDRHHRRRVVTTSKHRFGPAGEVGLLELDSGGLVSIEDPSATLLAERGRALPGSVATVLAEGTRPLVVEIQALVTPAVSTPARVAQGVSATRLRQLAAVVDAHCDLGIARTDLFVACSGAVKATEPAVDVAVVAAITSAFFGKALNARVVAIGEIGLTGSIRPVLSASRRLAEAFRVGLDIAVVPPGIEAPDSMRTLEVSTVAELIGAIHLLTEDLPDGVGANEQG